MFDIVVNFEFNHLKGDWTAVGRFSNLADAECYANRHDNEGGGKLRVIENSDCTPCSFIVNDDISFVYECEARVYTDNLISINGCGDIP